MGIHTSSLHEPPPDRWASSIEAIMGIVLTRTLLARERAERLRSVCTDAPPAGHPCQQLARNEAAADAWQECAALLADLLKQRREGGQP